MSDQHQRFVAVAALAAALLVAVVLALAISAAPASAYPTWAHDGATGCVSCHNNGAPTDATCTSCHTGFKSFPGQNCWSCHAPGQDTSTLSASSAACGQECHLWNSAQMAYLTPATHAANPHLGSTAGCLNCHQTSVSISNPGSSPHHSGQETGFTDCQACHATYQQHAGKLQCIQCHTTAVAFHLYQAASPGFKNCRACHAMKHAGKTVPANKCATCHKGTGSGGASVAQHSKSVTKKFVCGGCHKQKLHAKALSSAITGCRSCHGGKYHARQKQPSSSVCQRCHTAARRHADGFMCTLCHRSAIHNPRPKA